MSFGMGFAPPATAWQKGGGTNLVLALNFLTGTLDPSITFARTSTATYINSSGVITAASAGAPRFDYNPSTLQLNGLLLEGSRTNLLLNSLIDGTSLSTQSVTVTASTHTLSFYGTGTVDLTGAFVSTVVGTGAYPTRTTLIFAPTAGTLTLTVTGTVQFANLEVGGNPSSFMPTTGSTFNRTADNASITSIPWFNQTAGTMYVEAICNPSANPTAIQELATFSDGTVSNRLIIARNAAANTLLGRVNATAPNFPATAINGIVSKSALAYSQVALNTLGAVNGTLGSPGITFAGNVAATRLNLGADEVGNSGQLFGWLRTFNYYNIRLPNATLQSITA